MAINYNPTTVSDGLVLALDAANTRSYPGSGTAWTDISYRGNNGTLTNGPTFVAPPYNEPFGGAGGVYFDGTGDYLSVADNAALQMGSGDFTIEFWMNFSSIAGYQTLFSKGYTSAGSLLFQTDNGNGRMRIYIGSSNVISETGTGSTNTWIHYALVRSGTTLTLYRDGTSSGTATNSTNINNASTLYVGSSFTSPDYPLNGYISNLRVVKGTAVYTSNFTPPRVLLSRVPNTSLLTCQGGTIRDASSNNFTITPNGDASAVSYAPYIKFDGTNDYVTVGSFPNTTFDFGSGQFTLECWVNISVFAANTIGIYGFNTLYATGDGDAGSDFRFVITQGSTLGGYTTNGVYLSVNAIPIAIGAYSSFTTNTWYHVVASRIGNNLYLFLNGSLLSTTSYASSIPNATTYQPTIGTIQYRGSIYYQINGKISSFRVYRGKGLTAEEVLQNYNALKGRFGL